MKITKIEKRHIRGEKNILYITNLIIFFEDSGAQNQTKIWCIT
jgi:hypothetical protein